MKRPTALELELAAAEAERRVINAAMQYAAAVDAADTLHAAAKSHGLTGGMAGALEVQQQMAAAVATAMTAGNEVRKEAHNLHACRTALMGERYPGVMTGMGGVDPLRGLIVEWRRHSEKVRPGSMFPATGDELEYSANDAAAEAFDDCADELEHVLATFSGALRAPAGNDPPPVFVSPAENDKHDPGDCPTCQGYGVVGSRDDECPTCKGDGTVAE